MEHRLTEPPTPQQTSNPSANTTAAVRHTTAAVHSPAASITPVPLATTTAAHHHHHHHHRSPTAVTSSTHSQLPASSSTSCCSTDTEKTITQLEVQVEEQRLLRLQDAKQVEEKAAKIKEWVTNKLRELEEQNQVLREQNVKCNQQLQLLRNHLQSSPKAATTGGTPPQRNTNNNNGTAGLPTVPPASLRYSYSLDDSSARAISDELPTPVLLRRRPTTPATSGDPVALNLQTAALRLDDRRPRSDSPDSLNSLGQPPTSLRQQPHPQQQQQHHRRTQSMEPHELARDLAAAVDGLQLTPLNVSAASRLNANDGGAVDDDGDDDDYGEVGGGMDAVHDYAEIYTPVSELAQPVWLKTAAPPPVGGGGEASRCGSAGAGDGDAAVVSGKRRPPTPPLHRFPSWEAKIYQVAKDGLAAGDGDGDAGSGADGAGGDGDEEGRVPGDVAGAGGDETSQRRRHTRASTGGGGGERQSGVELPPGRMELTASGGYCDINVPVYATVKGVSVGECCLFVGHSEIIVSIVTSSTEQLCVYISCKLYI